MTLKKRIFPSLWRMGMLLALGAALLLGTGCAAAPAEGQGTASAGTESTEPEQTQSQRVALSDEEKYVMVEITMQDGGVMKLQLDREAAPITVDNFVKLASEGFYDGLTFHRIYKDFMIQGGDPDGNGTGGSGENITGEFEANGWDNPISHERGVISMARSTNPDSASSQFFIMHADVPGLDGDYAAFGKMVEGLDVLDALADIEVEPDDRGELSKPLVPPVIKSIRVVETDIDAGQD